MRRAAWGGTVGARLMFALTNENLGGAVRGLRSTVLRVDWEPVFGARVGRVGTGEGRWGGPKGRPRSPPWASFFDAGF